MDLYVFFKFLHVLAAILWVGGGFVLILLGLIASRQKNEAEMLRTLSLVGLLGPRLFAPMSVLVLITGIVMASLYGIWSEAWVLMALAGFLGSFLIGNFVLGRTGVEAGKLIAQGRTAEAVALGQGMMKFARFDYVILFVVVADMVLKPMWSDIALLALMGVVLVGGAALFLRPGAPAEPAAA